MGASNVRIIQQPAVFTIRNNIPPGSISVSIGDGGSALIDLYMNMSAPKKVDSMYGSNAVFDGIPANTNYWLYAYRPGESVFCSGPLTAGSVVNIDFAAVGGSGGGSAQDDNQMTSLII